MGLGKESLRDAVSWKEGAKFLVYGALFFVIASALFPGAATEKAYDIEDSVDDAASGVPTTAETPELCGNTDLLVNRIKTHGRINPPSDYSNHLIIDYKGEGLANWTATGDNGHGDFICEEGGADAPQPGYYYCEDYRNTPLVLDEEGGTAKITIDEVVLDNFKSLTSVSCASGGP